VFAGRRQEPFHDHFSRVLKNKHQALSQGGYWFEARGSRLKTNSDPVIQASSFQPFSCEHLQKPHNAGSRREALFQHPDSRIQRLRPSRACPPSCLLENRMGKEQ
jgi:hypothetical protein